MVFSGLNSISSCPSCGAPCLVYREFISTELNSSACMKCGTVSLTVNN
jgi:uncharacterized Zn finger protein|tara:strand:- start:6456 stop:6599 length:144 start_codon:yes stop_codon:yes gene_type:complete